MGYGDIECLILDMDTEGTEDDKIFTFNVFNENGMVKACAYFEEPAINPEFVEHYFKQVVEGD